MNATHNRGGPAFPATSQRRRARKPTVADLQPLKSCPFCGSAAKLLSFSRDREVVSVRCFWWGEGCMGAGTNEVSEEAARTAWNRRTPSPEQAEALRKAAQAVVDRWDTPLWKDAPHTAEFINALRAAIQQQEMQRLKAGRQGLGRRSKRG